MAYDESKHYPGESAGWKLGNEELGVVGTETINTGLRSIQDRSVVSWAEP